MSHIFISYSRDDLAFARYLRALLSQEGFSVWMDEQNLHAGTNWWKEIERNIDSCSAFVVVMSPAADESMYVHNEIHRALNQKKAIFPILLTGKPFSLLANIQYEDLRAGLNAKLSTSLVKDLHEACGVLPTERTIRFEVVQRDVRDLHCDVLVLKYAKQLYGADLAVVSQMWEREIELDLKPLRNTGSHMLVSSEGAVAPKNILFLGTKSLSYLDYRDVRTFTEAALHHLAVEYPGAKHVALSIHGPGFGLDEAEALMAQVGGIVDALQSGNVPIALERITFVEIVKDRVKRLRNAVTPFFEEVNYAQAALGQEWGYDLTFSMQTEQSAPDAGTEEIKPYALAIIPGDSSLDDIYYYGIQRPVHSQGLLCERITLDATPQENEEEGDLQATLQRTGQASLLICYLSEQTPLLNLHVGYAWGKGVPVIFVGRGGETTFYDEEVMIYEKIWELEERLSQQLASYEG